MEQWHKLKSPSDEYSDKVSGPPRKKKRLDSKANKKNVDETQKRKNKDKTLQ